MINHKVLQKYGLTMAKSPEKFHGIVEGNIIANYITASGIQMILFRI